VNQFLDEIRRGRTENESRSHEQAKRDEELVQARGEARTRALELGLPTPGADLKMLQKLQNRRLKRKRSADTKQSLLANEVKQSMQQTPNVVSTEIEHPKEYTSEDKSQSTTPEMARDLLETTTLEKKSMFEKLEDVFLEDYLSPHFVSPLVEKNYTEEGFHPPWKLKGSRLKRFRSRRPV
jgi:hypothetical protein